MKIYAIKRGSGYLEHCEFFLTKNLALLQFYTLVDKFRREPGFRTNSESFTYEHAPLPDDNGGYDILTSTYTIAEIDVKE